MRMCLKMNMDKKNEMEIKYGLAQFYIMLYRLDNPILRQLMWW